MRHSPGVELAGHLKAAVGAGEAARRYLDALRAVGVRVHARDVPLPGRDQAMAPLTRGRRVGRTGTRFNLLCLQPEQLIPYLRSGSAPPLKGRRNVGLWSWEVDVVPTSWAEAAPQVDEIWACSEFAARHIRAATDARVLAVLHPLATTAPPPAPAQRTCVFRVLVIFDYLSTLERKNPLGAIAAYRRAFAPSDGAQLVVKSMNGAHRPERRGEVELAAAGRDDILLRDETISSAERDALVESCDCLLSLHRSEGFGLALAEAMAAGKPVVATAYGGNTEFMDGDNSYLVPYELTLVGAGVEHYPAQATWAEPSVSRAADALREIFGDRQRAHARALRGQADVRAMLAPAHIGHQMLGRLEVLDQARTLPVRASRAGRWMTARRSGR